MRGDDELGTGSLGNLEPVFVPAAMAFPKAADVLARLAVFYLADRPVRVGVLKREVSAAYWLEDDDARDEEWREAFKDGLCEDTMLSLIRRQAADRLRAVGGNDALLGSRRADAVWLDGTDATREPLVEVHEIKVSSSDLKGELQRPEKSAAWMQRAHRFWLTVPDLTVIDGVDVPASWGILLLPFGRVPQVVRAAPELTPVARPRMKMARGRYTVACRLPATPSEAPAARVEPRELR